MDPDDSNDTNNFRNPQSPDPMQNSPQGSNLDEVLETPQSVPDDINIDPDTSLNGYQDDIDTSMSVEKLDTVQFEQGMGPSDVMQRSPEELKGGLDDAAMDEQGYSPEQHGRVEPNASDDLRENIEGANLDAGDESKY